MKVKGKLLLLLVSSLLLTGCSEQEEIIDTLESRSEQQENTQNDKTDTSLAEEMFTERDREVGFDEESDYHILLKEEGIECNASGVQITDNTVTITAEGTYILTGTLQQGSIVVDADKKDKIQLVLKGADITCESSAAIYVKQADKVFVTLAADTENRVCTEGEFIAIDDNNIDGAIFSKEDLTINGSGSLTVQATAGNGIVSKDDLVITGGAYDIEAGKHALEGKDSVRIADGTFVLQSGEDGIHGDNDEDDTKGFVYIAGGSFTIAAQDDGVHASSYVRIEEGTLNITESYEGIEGHCIDIWGGSIVLTASDDGLNAASKSSNSKERKERENPFAVDEEAYICIAGGSLTITAYGDGIDSNGNLYVTGGEVYVSGPESEGDGSLDYPGEGQITGGIVVAAGSSAMAQNFDASSTQGSMLVQLSTQQSAGTVLELTDEEGKVLVRFTPETKYSCVVISTPELQKNHTYTLTAGEETQVIEMTNTIYNAGGIMGGGMHGGMWGFGKGEHPEIPEGLEGERPEMPEGLEGERPEIPEGFEGEHPEIPEGLEGERPEIPEGLEGERPEIPEGLEGERPEIPKALENERPETPKDLEDKSSETPKNATQ